MPKYEPMPGDIAACWGTDFQSRFISLVTARLRAPKGLKLSPSHVAFVAPDYHRTRLLWYESTTMCGRKCLFWDRQRSGVQVHRIDDRASDYTGRGGKVVIYRLVSHDDMDEVATEYLQKKILFPFLQKRTPYDLRGALFSGLRVTSRLLSLLGFSREHLFCSDMIASILMRLGILELDDPDLYTPGGLMRLLVNEGIYEEHATL